jgi:hypothetical protein
MGVANITMKNTGVLSRHNAAERAWDLESQDVIWSPSPVDNSIALSKWFNFPKH